MLLSAQGDNKTNCGWQNRTFQSRNQSRELTRRLALTGSEVLFQRQKSIVHRGHCKGVRVRVPQGSQCTSQTLFWSQRSPRPKQPSAGIGYIVALIWALSPAIMGT